MKKKSVIDSPPHWVKWRVFVFLHFTEYTLGGWCFASNTQPFTHLMEIDFVGCFFFVFFAFSRGLIYKHNNTNGFFVFSFHLLLLLLLQTLFHTSLSLLLSQSVFIYIIISEPTNWNADFIASRSTDTTRFTAFDFFLARFFFSCSRCFNRLQMNNMFNMRSEDEKNKIQKKRMEWNNHRRRENLRR